MIRAGTLQDARQISSSDPFGGDREAEAREKRLWIEVDAAGRPKGYVSVARCLFHGNPYVEFLFVKPEARRHGVASRLLGGLEQANKGRRLFISTEQPNEAMLALLAQRGYRHSGSLQGLNDDHGAAAEIFFYRDV